MCELEPALIRTEIAVIRRQRPENLDAWGCYQQATAALALKSFNESSIEEARAALLRAVAIDPSFALAHANFSLITAVAINVGFIEGRAAASKMVREFAERALALDDASSQVLGYAGCALCDIGRSERGTEMLEHSLILDPSNAQAHVALGAAQALAGDVGTGAERMRYGMRISPRDRRLAFWGWSINKQLLACQR